MIEARRSLVRRVYDCSISGSRRPRLAAELALRRLDSAESGDGANSRKDANLSKSAAKHQRQLSAVSSSASLGVSRTSSAKTTKRPALFPRVVRMLSRQE